MNTPTLLRAAALISIPLAFSLAGYSLSFSQNCVTHMYMHPASLSVPMFGRIYHDGALVVAPGALASASASAYLAYSQPDQRPLWAVASSSAVGAIAYTVIVMKPGIDRLLKIGESEVEMEKAQGSGEHVELMKGWVASNYLRATLYFTGGMCGLVAAVGLY